MSDENTSDKNENISSAFLYARVSTGVHAENGSSISKQIEELRRYCESRGISVAGEFLEGPVDAGDDQVALDADRDRQLTCTLQDLFDRYERA